MKTTVVHLAREVYDVRIDRQSPFGNPFRMRDKSEAERARVIAEYRNWLPKQPHLMAQLHALKGKRLGCWCAPAACHGDMLAELADKLP